MNEVTLRGGGYDALTAYHLARLADLAYADAETAETEALACGFPRARWISESGSECLIVANDSAVVLAYRGTSPRSLLDLTTDVNCRLVPGPFGFGEQVHAGFADYVARTWDAVLFTIWNFRREGQSLFVAGHSLGAAAATLATAKLVYDPRGSQPVDGTYLYGSPRVGNRHFADLYDLCFSTTYPHRNNNDAITRVPCCLDRYQHVARHNLRHYTADGAVWHNPGPLAVCCDRWQGRRRGLFQWGTDGLVDHSTSAYIRLTRSKVESRERRVESQSVI